MPKRSIRLSRIVLASLTGLVLLFQACSPSFQAQQVQLSQLDLASQASRGSNAKGGAAAEYLKTKIGIMYSLWHCPYAEDISHVYDITKIQNGEQQFGPLGYFHLWGRPQGRYYCLARNRQILTEHAFLLRDAGVDFIYLDITNHASIISDRPTEMILQLLQALIEVWSKIPGAPKVVPWVPVTTVAVQDRMIDRVLSMLDKESHLYPISSGRHVQ